MVKGNPVAVAGVRLQRLEAPPVLPCLPSDIAAPWWEGTSAVIAASPESTGRSFLGLGSLLALESLVVGHSLPPFPWHCFIFGGGSARGLLWACVSELCGLV